MDEHAAIKCTWQDGGSEGFEEVCSIKIMRLNVMKRFWCSQKDNPCRQFLERVQGGLFVEREGEADAVNLPTYFRAKGRQWHTVLVPGANQKVIPHARADLEDERRLFYVATTRATANLVFSYVRQAVRSKVEPSQFLAELGLGEGEEKRATFLS